MIHCIGNSHACVFSGDPEHPGKFPIWPKRHKLDTLAEFRTYSIGPVICYNFYEHHHRKVLDIIKTVPIPKNDYIMYCIGEVDCRWHIPHQATLQKRTIDDVTTECVHRYFRSLKEVHDMGHQVMGWMAHPSTTYEPNDNPDSPIYGTCEVRNNISRAFNAALKKLCDENSIYFLDIFDQLLDQKTGMTDMNYYLDNDYCHLSAPKIMPLVMERLTKDKMICS